MSAAREQALAPSGDVVRTAAEAAAAAREPLLVLEPLQAFLDAAGVGRGPVTAEPIGDGHSNVTYALARDGARVVLRRPPRGPLPPSAHDVLREARLLALLRPAGVRVPEVLAVCEDREVVGAPFYVMERVDGEVLTGALPAALDDAAGRAAVGAELVDALAELHAVDLDAAGLTGFGAPDGYLERQVRRFRGLLERTATRPLPLLEQVADWLDANRPRTPRTTVVHGDYRLGNVLFSASAPARLEAVLDWELAALGDPLADLGYLTAMWAVAGEESNVMLDLTPVTRLPGFLTREELAARYAQRSGLDPAALGWYQALAVWKAAIFLEGSYRRYLAGSTDDPYFGRLGEGVPQLARTAARLAQAA